MPKKRTNRRARGTGTIFQRPDGTWIGRKSINGARVERWGATQGEVVAKLNEATPPGSGTTVAEWAEKWFSTLGIRPSSLGDYRHTIDKFIIPTLGHIRVCKLTAHDVERAAREWSARLGPNTLRKNVKHLRTMMEAARRARSMGLDHNPAADAKIAGGKRVAIDPFSPAELARIIADAAENPGARIFAVLASVGCRIGEAIALNVEDFDPVNGTLSITKTYTAKHGTRPPKSENGIREVRVPAQAVPVILAAIGSRKSGPLFAKTEGGRRQHKTVRESWIVSLNRLGLRYRRPHQLRHSVATAWIAGGVGVGDVAKHLGDSVQTVVAFYVHSSGADPSRVMETLLGGRKVGSAGQGAANQPRKQGKVA